MDGKTKARTAAISSFVFFTLTFILAGSLTVFGHLGSDNKELSAISSALRIFNTNAQNDILTSLSITLPKIQDGSLLVGYGFLFFVLLLMALTIVSLAIAIFSKDDRFESIYNILFHHYPSNSVPIPMQVPAVTKLESPQEVMFEKSIFELKNAIQELTKIVNDGSEEDIAPIQDRCDEYYDKIIKIASKSNLICNGVRDSQKTALSASQRLQKLSTQCRSSSNFSATTKLEWKKNSMMSTISQVGRSYDKIQDLVVTIKSTNESCNRLLVEAFNTEKVVKEKQEQIVTRLNVVQSDSVVAFRQFDKLFELIGGSGDKVRDAGRLFSQISQRSETISQIVRAFENVSEQINLQTLNASIEAAKYGPRGQEFSEIAEEIRKLSDKSSHATRTLSNLLSSVQEEIEKGFSLLNVGGDNINESYQTAQKCQEFFRTSTSANKKVISELDLVKTDSGIQNNKLLEIENLNKHSLISFDGLKELLRKELGANSKICTESTKLAEHCEKLSSLISKQYYEMTHCSTLLQGTVNSLIDLEGHANEGKHIIYGFKSSIEDSNENINQHPMYAATQKVAASRHLSSMKSTTEALEVLSIKKA